VASSADTKILYADAERFVFSAALSSGGVKEMRAEKSISSIEAGSDSCTKCIQTAAANIVPVGSARNKTVLQQLAAACVRRAHIFSFGATRAEREAVCVECKLGSAFKYILWSDALSLS
jgi:hypothetical protein